MPAFIQDTPQEAQQPATPNKELRPIVQPADASTLDQNFGLAEQAESIGKAIQSELKNQGGALNIPGDLPTQDLPTQENTVTEPTVETDIKNTAEYKITELVLDDTQLSKVGNFEILRELEDPQLNQILDKMKDKIPSFIAATENDKSPYTWHADRIAPPYNSAETFKQWLIGDLMSDKLYFQKPVRGLDQKSAEALYAGLEKIMQEKYGATPHDAFVKACDLRPDATLSSEEKRTLLELSQALKNPNKHLLINRTKAPAINQKLNDVQATPQEVYDALPKELKYKLGNPQEKLAKQKEEAQKAEEKIWALVDSEEIRSLIPGISKEKGINTWQIEKLSPFYGNENAFYQALVSDYQMLSTNAQGGLGITKREAVEMVVQNDAAMRKEHGMSLFNYFRAVVETIGEKAVLSPTQRKEYLSEVQKMEEFPLKRMYIERLSMDSYMTIPKELREIELPATRKRPANLKIEEGAATEQTEKKVK